MTSARINGQLIDVALSYAERGWQIIPVHTARNGVCSCREKQDCRAAGKHPREAKWTSKFSIDPVQIARWWKKWPTANIGIVTGSPSGLVVFDFDPRHGGDDTLNQLRGEFPEITDTFTVKTGGGGWHLYFQIPECGAKTAAGALRGLDIRGQNGMVIAAGSTHVSGGKYEIENDVPAIQLPAGLLKFVQWTQKGHRRDIRATQINAESTQINSVPTQIISRATQINADQHKQVELAEKRTLNLETLTDAQKEQIQDAIVLSSNPCEGGKRNKSLFEFLRRLLTVDDIDQTIDLESLRPLILSWYNALKKSAQSNQFEVRGTFAQTMEDARYAWGKIRSPNDDSMPKIIQLCGDALRNGKLPDQVARCVQALGYDDEHDTIGVILLCWCLNEICSPAPFFLSARTGQSALAAIGTKEPRNHQWVARHLKLLTRDEVIRCTSRAEPGQRKFASEYIWSWVQPKCAATNLDWLQF